MESIVDYFSQIPSSHRSIILLGGLTFFMVLEFGLPFYRARYNKAQHFGINLFFTFTTVLVNFLMAVILLKSSDWAIEHQFGILQWLPEMPLWVFIFVGLLLLDFIGAYAAHWMEHKVKWMWRFHLVHHTDPNVDATTANRHHPGESVIRFAFTTVAAVLAGAPMYLIMLYQSMSAALSQFNHANVNFPVWAEKILGFLIVTPRMHRVHHHYVLPFTDTNYGNIFSVWDRLFGTYAEMENRQIVFGIDTHMAPEEQANIGTLLKIPFQPYRQPEGAKFEG
ncbi:MAG: sterol desaturase family protein [Saprospiraceae bacterium]|nr:sterol desaturase family protein [Saprospiraceae bacterium]